MAEALIHLDGVKKVFYTEEVETHALAGIHLDIQIVRKSTRENYILRRVDGNCFAYA